MGVTKSDYFSEAMNELSEIFKALGHPARIAIIEHLLDTKACVCNDLVLKLPLAQATISQHLSALKKVNLIQGSIEGNSICYCLNPAVFDKVKKYLFDINLLSASTCC